MNIPPIGRYISLFTDFGFKRIFGTERNKDLLIDFLNCVLAGETAPITHLRYLNQEQLGKHAAERRAVFDLYCESTTGEKFIIELQKAEQQFFKDRSLYYASFAIQEQAQKGKAWDYSLQPVYCVSVMDFVFDEAHPQQVVSQVELRERSTNRLFYDKLLFVYLEMPKFNKSLHQLQGNLERWLYVFKNMHYLDKVPAEIREGVLLKLFQECEIAQYKPQERMQYEQSWKEKNDLYAVITTAEQKGIEKGLIQTALNAIAEGLSDDLIQKLTGLPLEVIQKLREKKA